MTGLSSIQLLKYLEDEKLIKKLNNVYYLTDRLLANTKNKNSPKELLKQFCEDIELPFQITSPNGTKYTIKYITDRIGKAYLKALKEVDREDLIKITKKYYLETEYPVTIGRYFDENVWEVAMESEKNSLAFKGFED